MLPVLLQEYQLVLLLVSQPVFQLRLQQGLLL